MQAILYLSHGGGPLPLLNESHHHGLISFLSRIGPQLGKPKAILMISAHWEESIATVSSAAHPAMLYDYSGFPEQAYKIRYPAPGQPQLASEIVSRLRQQGFEACADSKRGFDHGTFVPLKLMYPKAEIPIVQLSLLSHLDASAHIELGKAIGEWSKQGVLIIGSGFSFHNQAFSPTTDPAAIAKNTAFDQWLNTTVVASGLSLAEREQALIHWDQAPHARYAHPREEHLLPLQVCFGAARVNGLNASNVFDETMYGAKISSFLWQ